MNYSTMTKTELIEKIDETEKKRAHLSSTVQDQTKTINNMKEAAAAKSKEVPAEAQRQIDDLSKENKNLSDLLQRRVKEINGLIDNHSSLLKLLQGALDMSIGLSDSTVRDITKE